MSRQTFTWYPDLGAKRDSKPNVHQIKFGDGYELRLANGINSKPLKWTLVFNRAYSEASAILAFLDAQGGTQSFYYTDAMNVTGVYVCREYSSSQKVFGVWEINATFEQVFEV